MPVPQVCLGPEGEILPQKRIPLWWIMVHGVRGDVLANGSAKVAKFNL
jgi:hypothetical protein